ncbi:hypothetical protein WEI85_32480 [Actinomycetes bacterium KLBMP 9797]
MDDRDDHDDHDDHGDGDDDDGKIGGHGPATAIDHEGGTVGT